MMGKKVLWQPVRPLPQTARGVLVKASGRSQWVSHVLKANQAGPVSLRGGLGRVQAEGTYDG